MLKLATKNVCSSSHQEHLTELETNFDEKKTDILALAEIRSSEEKYHRN